MSHEYFMNIGGRNVQGVGTFDVINPANGQVIGKAPDASKEQLDQAVKSAREAFPGWSATSIDERRAALGRIADVIEANIDELKRLVTAEQGKPYAEAEWEVGGSALWFRGTGALDLPETVNEDTEERYSVTRRVPIGVVGAIAPWNFPIILACWKVAPALLAGNTVVLKPSPFTPLSTLRMGELLQEVLPPGVLNVVTGGDDFGPWMSAHPGIDKISFTGSTATGRKVMESASANLKRLTLELGGNDPAIVLPDVDIEKVVPELFWAAFRNSGQICVAAKRMYVHDDIYDALAKGLADYAKGVSMGDGSQQGVELGPVQNALQFGRVKDLVQSAKTENLKFVVGGDIDEAAPGYFVPVTIVDNPPDDSRVVTEEAFGPVLPLLRFYDVDEVVRRANDSNYGLGASIWTANPEQAAELAPRLQCGTVWINEIQHVTPFATFAGHKQSGIGVENGVDGLMEYTNSQTMTIKRG